MDRKFEFLKFVRSNFSYKYLKFFIAYEFVETL